MSLNTTILRPAVFLLAFALAPALPAAPTVTSIQNAASNIAPGLPNAPLAQGAIFVIKGSGLGPATLAIAPAAFQTTTLSGTSVTITAGATTVNAPLYYTSDTQVAALLPSGTPTGTATFKVTYNGQTSSAAGHGIVANNLGLFTIDSSGQGPGIVSFPDYSLVSAVKAANCGGPNTTCGAANPGDTLVLWGTGLGPVSGDDASGARLGQPMADIPLTVWLGGVQAPVIYQGRSGCCIGEDQIVFKVPDNTPTGCAVPLLIQIGNTISNNTVIPVASGDRNCTLTNAALRRVDVEPLSAAGPVTFGDIDMEKDGGGNGYQDFVHLTFARILSLQPGSQPFLASFIDLQPPGTCLVYNGLNPNNNPPFTGLAPLDSGSGYTIQGPNGSMTLPVNKGKTSTLSATGTFLGPGSYTVTGKGGADVGPFSATITVPALPTLVSPTSAANLTVIRSGGMTINWKGGSGNVQIALTGATDKTFNTGASALCRAPANTGTFTIPPYVLMAIPAGTFNQFFVGSAESDVAFTATGLNVGNLHTQSVGPGFDGFVMK
jgi:uncharacterized protein (TIGR03437 family)